jgi:hypothetical protein
MASIPAAFWPERGPGSVELSPALESLGGLQHGWDGDGAPAPSATALARTRALLGRLIRRPDEIDPDAIGGVALWFYFGGADGRKVMVGIRNEDGRGVLCSYHHARAIPEVEVFTDDAEFAAQSNARLAAFA